MIASYFRVSNKILEKLKAHPEKIEDIVFDSEELQEIEFDIDKAWHGIYFLLTGKVGFDETVHCIVGQAILGGRELGEDIGYGPLRFLEPSEVAIINNELRNISVEDLANRFDLEAINDQDIYPMSGEWEMEDKDYLLEYYEGLLNYFNKAANEQEAMLLLIQ
jgi:type I restriction-modification system DNA methylase subunit